MGIIRDSINRGFTVGDVTTVDYDSEAKIKVKEYYELDKLERKKLLELAEQIDAELAKRDIKLEELEERISSGSGAGSLSEGMNVYYPPTDNSYYVLYKKIITRSEIDEKCRLTLDKYNNMTSYEKSNFDYVLTEQFGYQLPVTTEKIEEFINGKPTGMAQKNLMFICRQFSECIELNTDLNVEVYKTGFKAEYPSEDSSCYKLFLPKLTIYISSSGDLIFLSQEAFGKWEVAPTAGLLLYDMSSGCPVILGYSVLENGDYEITINLNISYKGHYLLKTNVEAERVSSLPNMRKNINLLTEVTSTSIVYNSAFGYTPININHYLTAISVEKIQNLRIYSTVSTQISEVKIALYLKEDVTMTAGDFTDAKIEIFKNIAFSNVSGTIEIELTGNSGEKVRAVLNRSYLSIIVPKSETLVLKKNTVYEYRGSFIKTTNM